MAPAFHIYAPDFRGHGKSDWSHGHYRLQDYTNDVIAFLQHQLTKPAYLFGHSLGGMVALLVAAQYPTGVHAAVVGDAPLSGRTWQAVLRQNYDRLVTWRDMAGGQQLLENVIEFLKDSPTEVPGQNTPVPLREVWGEDSPVFSWIATNLIQNDPDMLTAIMERFAATVAGYEMDTVLPAIECPVLLLQADPKAGGLMTDSEAEQALSLLTHGSHVRLEGMSHILHNQQKEPIVEAITTFFQAW